MEQLSHDVEMHLQQLDVYLGAEAVDALHNYVTSQIALLLLDFEAIRGSSRARDVSRVKGCT